MSVHAEPEDVGLHSEDDGRRFEYPMTSIGLKPNKIDFGGAFGDILYTVMSGLNQR